MITRMSTGWEEEELRTAFVVKAPNGSTTGIGKKQEKGASSPTTPSATTSSASTSLEQDDQPVHDDLLAAHQAVIRKLVSDSSERLIEAVLEQTRVHQANLAKVPRQATKSSDSLTAGDIGAPFLQFALAGARADTNSMVPSAEVLGSVATQCTIDAYQTIAEVRASDRPRGSKADSAGGSVPSRAKEAPTLMARKDPQQVKRVFVQPPPAAKPEAPLIAKPLPSKEIAELSAPKPSAFKSMLRAGGGTRTRERRQTHISLDSFDLAHLEGEDEGRKLRGIFADGEAMKQKLRDAIAKPQYDVSNFYKTEGWCQAIARSQYFENITLLVIALNAIWISIDVDLNKAEVLLDAHWAFQVADNFFCLYFVAEWAVRFGAFEIKSDSMRDMWFVFDSIMCALMALETWVITLFFLVFAGSSQGDTSVGDASLLKAVRLVRLARMARVLRLLNALPELMVLIKGITVAARAVSCTVALMLLIVYVFAVAFRQLTDGTALGKSVFKSVPDSMRYLLISGTMPDLQEHVMEIWSEGWVFAVIFLMFVLVCTITVMNMLVGVLVGVVNTVAAVEKEQLMVEFVKTNLLGLLRKYKIDQDSDGLISKEEFDRLVRVPEALKSLDKMGVDPIGLIDLADFIFKDGDSLRFSNFMELVMQLRGSNQATVKDVVDLRKFITLEFGQMKAEILSTKAQALGWQHEEEQLALPGSMAQGAALAKSRGIIEGSLLPDIGGVQRDAAHKSMQGEQRVANGTHLSSGEFDLVFGVSAAELDQAESVLLENTTPTEDGTRRKVKRFVRKKRGQEKNHSLELLPETSAERLD